MLNFIAAMFQFHGGIPEEHRGKLVTYLKRMRNLTIDSQNRVAFPESP